MKPHHIPLRRWAFLAGLATTSLVIQGCASEPRPRPAPPSVPAPAAPKPDKGQMAPIPNPPEDQKSPAPSTAVAIPPRPAKPAAPKVAPGRAPSHPSDQTPTAANSARAAKLRASGLEQLNRGAVDRAVTLLQQASRLDPTNELIQHDLERAVRISEVVHAKP